MTHTLPAASARPRPAFGDEPKRLLESRQDRTEADHLRRDYAQIIRKARLRAFGVFVQPLGDGYYGVFVGRHDGGDITPDADALTALKRLRRC